MKKRGRRPNARTYTIMLTGLSRASPNSGLDPLKTALSIYESMHSPNSIVMPNVTHANAMLTVCARQQDMDMLWKVAGDLPHEGEGAPDSRTYSIILRAIRESSQRDLTDIDPKDVDKVLERKSRTVREGKRIWSDIIFQWKRGQFTLDNIIVNSMAQILLDGSNDQDCYDTLALYNQTFGIPILAKNPADITKHRRDRGSRKTSEEAEDVPFVDKHNQPIKETGESDEPDQEENFEGLFDPVVGTGSQRAHMLSYLTPTNRELSTILEVCRSMTQGTGAGKSYWQHFTQGDHEQRIQPDSHSFHQYLRLLRVSRSSRAALEVVRDEMGPTDQAESKTFHIALSCCQRDRRNTNMFNTANELLGLMTPYLLLPDLRALLGYLDIVDNLADNPQFLMSLKGIGIKPETDSHSLDTYSRRLQVGLRTTAAHHLHPHVVRLEEAMEQTRSQHPSSRSKKVASSFNATDFPGSLALKVMVRTRAMIDLSLKLDPKVKPLLADADRKWLQEESKLLKKYSGEDVTDKFRTAVVVPTLSQKKQFEDERKRRKQQRI